MGIPYYFYTLTKTYGNIITNTLPCNPDIYCIDFNGVIHPICAEHIATTKKINEEDLIKDLYQKVENDVKKFDPKKTLICVDGIVPLAKMIQQRKRRYLTVYRNKIDKTDVKWDTNSITPGTDFMKKLNTYFKKQIRYNSTKTNILFSGSDEYGEGEHKIFEMLLSDNDSKSVVINGLDADLIILCLMSNRKNIYLMRENGKTTTFVVIENLRTAIIKELIDKWKLSENLLENIYSNSSKDVIESYCVMCSLLGNDFIPHLMTLNLKSNGLDKLISYTHKSSMFHGLLVKDGKINYSCLSDIMQQIAKSEDSDIFEETEKYIRKTYHGKNSDSLESDFYAIKHKDEVADKIYANPEKWRNTYYKYLFHANVSHDSSVITTACYNYIVGIYWTYAYYKRSGYDNTWYYPYAYPPSVRDIYNYAIGNNEPVIANIPSEINTNIQLMIVLPVESKSLLEDKYQRMMEDEEMCMKHLYPRKYKIHTYLKTHLWECSPILPMINLSYIKSHILK
jgi:5'-3' exoribonuclease 2